MTKLRFLSVVGAALACASCAPGERLGSKSSAMMTEDPESDWNLCEDPDFGCDEWDDVVYISLGDDWSGGDGIDFGPGPQGSIDPRCDGLIGMPEYEPCRTQYFDDTNACETLPRGSSQRAKCFSDAENRMFKCYCQTSNGVCMPDRCDWVS